MLKAYSVMLGVLRELRPVLVQIEKHDRDLGNQLRRASASVVLNVAEGGGSSGGTRTARYRTALGYVERVDEKMLDALDHVRAILARVVR